MSKYDTSMLKETLKIQIRDDYFSSFRMTQIGRIDFAISKANAKGGSLGLFDNFDQYFLWAEAKKGANHDIYESFVQLILTIGRERTFEKYLPPIFIGAFDAEKIAFVDYSVVANVFIKNDFNWNVTPSNHSTKEFKCLLELVKDELEDSSLIFNYESQDKELKAFIKNNFVVDRNNVRKIEITKNNFTSVYYKWLKEVKPSINIKWEIVKKAGLTDADFYLADLLLKNNETLKDALFVLLKTNHYEFGRKIDEYGLEAVTKASFNDNQVAHKIFWDIYKRPSRKDFWQYIIDRRDLLVPQDIRERKGSYFTPQIWVEKSQEYLMRELGENWQDEYYIWDCCAGTGNLLNGLTNKYNIWASTIDQADVDVMKDRIKNGANLLENHVFKFDFLNDSFDALPDGLKNIINSEEKRKKLVIYINPPYAEADNRKGTGRKDVAISMIQNKYADFMGYTKREMYIQFITRIYNEIPNCKIGLFSTLKHIQAPRFKCFRDNFSSTLNSLFIVPAYTFDNVKGSFPISFQIWSCRMDGGQQRTNYKNMPMADIFDEKGNNIGKLNIICYDYHKLINDWIKLYKGSKKEPNSIGTAIAIASDFQNQRTVRIEQPYQIVKADNHNWQITKNNLLVSCVYLAVRLCISSHWFNNRENFLYPDVSVLKDYMFCNDCLIYIIFHGQNKISSSVCINHWIPFKESEIDTRDVIESHFMSDYIKNIKFSKTAQDVLDSARNLYSYYHSKSDSNPNASYYDIREYFQGRNDKGNLNVSSEDETYNQLISDLKEKHKLLSREIEPKIYEYGFLIR